MFGNPFESPKSPQELIMKQISSVIDRLHKLEEMESDAWRSSMEALTTAAGYERRAGDLSGAIPPSGDEYKEQHRDSVKKYALDKKAAADALADLANMLGDEQDGLKLEIQELYKDLRAF